MDDNIQMIVRELLKQQGNIPSGKDAGANAFIPYTGRTEPFDISAIGGLISALKAFKQGSDSEFIQKLNTSGEPRYNTDSRTGERTEAQAPQGFWEKLAYAANPSAGTKYEEYGTGKTKSESDKMVKSIDDRKVLGDLFSKAITDKSAIPELIKTVVGGNYKDMFPIVLGMLTGKMGEEEKKVEEKPMSKPEDNFDFMTKMFGFPVVDDTQNNVGATTLDPDLQKMANSMRKKGLANKAKAESGQTRQPTQSQRMVPLQKSGAISELLAPVNQKDKAFDSSNLFLRKILYWLQQGMPGASTNNIYP